MSYESKFTNGTSITAYLATVYVEGVLDGEGSSSVDKLYAWSYLIGTNIVYKLQGWFGAQATVLINHGVINEDGSINKELIRDTYDDSLEF